MCQSDPATPTEAGESTITRGRSWLDAIGPGILVAATGVGAGDLAGGALAGARLKLTVLWVCLVGAALKYVLCEGLARWQLSTGTSVADGVFRSTHPLVRTGFLLYVAAWSFCIGGMLMSAGGECAQAILPIGDASFGRIVHGSLQSLVAIVLLRLGGFRLFERMMAVCIGVMFFTVVLVAALSAPDWAEVMRGLVIPSVPHADGKGVAWTLTLMAGVGGTLTMLCYGSWIREKGRVDISAMRACRIDLAAGYLMTAAFGVCMVILGSRLPIDQGLKGANLITQLSIDMQQQLGEFGMVASWMFRIGAWGAVFSSLLGVWQSIPELICEMLPKSETASATGNNQLPDRRRYNTIQLLLGIVPVFLLPFSLAKVQLVAGVTGAIFLPMFALALLLLGYTALGKQNGFRNGPFSTGVLTISLLLFGFLAAQRFLT
ncbi:MAG TPA: divalent metal cation transporter [Planctomycetes bacterium]|nr:divalent metal cation transporter [Fuerstiella sp.]HIK95606.1 divalent metal cation transporter [Planctomycetota bacterium]